MKHHEMETYLEKLGIVYDALGGHTLKLGICGGAALILTDMLDRATKDIDLLFPSELPAEFWEAAKAVAQEYDLPSDWINQGPKELSEMGLPTGYMKRAIEKRYGKNLIVFFASRLDQIHFKLYAAADRAGYHVDDLLALKPTSEEIEKAAIWSFQHDVSEGFKEIMFSMLEKIGYGDVTDKI